VSRDGQRISTLDLFGGDFVLLTGVDGRGWVDAAAKASGVTVHLVGPGADVVAGDGEFETAYGLSASGAVLVRPDGVVAWRVDAIPADPAAELAAALEQVLARAAVTTAA
jgi:hypothetical protein